MPRVPAEEALLELLIEGAAKIWWLIGLSSGAFTTATAVMI
jgi:hypothetical protein